MSFINWNELLPRRPDLQDFFSSWLFIGVLPGAGTLAFGCLSWFLHSFNGCDEKTQRASFFAYNSALFFLSVGLAALDLRKHVSQEIAAGHRGPRTM